MRTFIAFPLKEDTQKMVSCSVEPLKNYISTGIKWVIPQNYHITLAFLGDISTHRLSYVEKVLREATIEQSKFFFTIGSLQIAPSRHMPRTLWYKMESTTNIPSRLYSAITTKLIAKGYSLQNRVPHFHLTIARIKQPSSINWKEVLKKCILIEKAISCDRVVLFKSNLTPKGPQYTIISKFLLTH